MIYLYIKQHTITKLKYFGRTEHQDPLKYKGSGSYWTRHLNKHGRKFVETLQLWEFEDQEEATNFAINFSEENNIIESKEWANLIIEDAKHSSGKSGYKPSEETKLKISTGVKSSHSNQEVRNKISKSLTGRKLSVSHRENVAKASSMRTHSDESKQKISESKRGKKHSPEARQRMSEAAKRRSKSIGD